MKFEDVDFITVYKENGDLVVRFFEDEEGIKSLCKDGYFTDIAEEKKTGNTIKDIKKCTRDELINELKTRESITHVAIGIGEGANLKHMRGNVFVAGPYHVFFIEPFGIVRKEDSELKELFAENK